MTTNHVPAPFQHAGSGWRVPRPPRLLAQLWGTTRLSDCLVALGHLAYPARLVRGQALATYEQAFARRIGVRAAVSFSSGRVALYALLRCMGIGTGDEVLLQVPTHVVVPNAVRYAGAKPVYVDCSLETYNMDLAQAERLITPRTKAILLQHTFGIPADMDTALALARRHRLIVIEDCVHALGTTYDGRPAGSFGEGSFFSTEETKTISSTMGGMAVANDPALAARLREFQANCPWPSAGLAARYLMKLVIYHFLGQPWIHPYSRPVYMHLRRTTWTHVAPGATSAEEQRGIRPPHYERRLSNAQAAIALRQLRRLDGNLSHRRLIAEAYASALSQAGLRVPVPPAKAEPAYVRYPVWVEDRESAIREAKSCTVLGQWFNSVLEEAESPAYAGYVAGSCPRAEDAARHLVNIPTHPRVTLGDARRIAEALAEAATDWGVPASVPDSSGPLRR